MKKGNTMGIFFFFTAHTREAVQHLAAALDDNAHLHDLTSYERGALARSFAPEDLVVVGAPVYGGRIPALAAERLQQTKGSNTPAIAVVTYGNRDYEDALLELKTILEQNGFVVIGAAALIAEHSIVHSVGHDRPDEADWKQLEQFAAQMGEKLEQKQIHSVAVTGNQPYRSYNGIPLKPKASHACVRCGFCVRECPAGAIPGKNPRKTDRKKCISCMRCVTYCPQKARSVNELLWKVTVNKLEKACSVRRENEFFVS